MQKQSIISVFKAATILVSLVVLLTMVEPCSASRGTMNMNQPSLKWLTLLQSLDHTPSPTPGNGCNETGTGGNPCKPPVNEKAFAGRNRATATTPSPPSPSLLLSVETATNRKLMMWSH
ncbi:hypothetical protein L1987_50543 [Smallanthus sonchifolius]|uniref:Uncharacterized protein n=1 Tax=Smallanthus sonchifolius TaxID=185202 RepID=A0ACB9ENX4_9ASTR|nr:hypothetical protein L1987_50543 [Smallanthus sonchifolius]